ncbi:MAG: lipoyl(octanoyl) transferase LipB [Candidatus Omnitrophica bacterium]|nr:lipoyl(octanoyl) transferase LipB [Candidatus Omnitrophota bacterium]
MSFSIRIDTLGLIDYSNACARQKALVAEVVSGGSDTLILCEHPAVITLGRRSLEANILLGRKDLAQKGVSVISADRGGDVTLHAPGQLIIYPIINLKRAGLDLRQYLQKLEQVAVDLLEDFGIVATGDDARRGVWIGKEKIASIGVGVSRWVAYHGMGLNVSTDLSLFPLIRPCGMDVRMTSLEKILGRPIDMADVKAKLGSHFVKIFQEGTRRASDV